MEPLSIIIGLSILLISFIWYIIYTAGKEIQLPEPPIAVPHLQEPRILLPVEFDDLKHPSTELLTAFDNLKLIVMGYKITPEQTSPQQAREQTEGNEQELLDKYAASLSSGGLDVTTQVTYTPNLVQSLKNYTAEYNCQAILMPRPIDSLKRLLVPIYSEDQVTNRLKMILRDLAGSSRLPLSVLLLTGSESEEDNDNLKKSIHRKFAGSGISEENIRVTSTGSPNIVEAVEQVAGDEDLLVLSEPEETDRETLFSTLIEDISDAASCSTLVVLRENGEAG